MTTAPQPSVSRRTAELAALNRRLADWLRQEPAELVEGAEAALEDELVVCGLLGGKDVGKSTLINALAGATVSVEREEVGEGTSRPRAYIHRASETALRSRLRTIAAEVPLDVTYHEADAIRRVILMDLPDFDSEFLDHLRIVQRVSPLLDRVVWVMTPRKIVDRAWVQMARQVVKDEANTYGVLNKLDELLADDEPFLHGNSGGTRESPADAFWGNQFAWFRRHLSLAGFALDEARCFQFAAAYAEVAAFDRRVAEMWGDADWTRFANDREVVQRIARKSSADIARLREAVLAPLSSERARALKEANASVEHSANARRMRQYFELDRLHEQLAPAADPDYAKRVLDEAFDENLRTQLARSVRSAVRTDRELADELLERRVEHWPLLRLVHWPFGWLSRLIGRGLAAHREPKREGYHVLSEWDALSWRQRVDAMRSRLLVDMSPAAERLRLDEKLPESDSLASNLAARLKTLPPNIEGESLDLLWPVGRRPSWGMRILLWMVALWFVIAQPLLEGGLRMYTSRGTFDLAEGAYHVVSTFSAPRLGVSLLVVAGVFVGFLAVLYANGLRRIRRLREASNASPVDQRIEECLINEVLAPMLQPFQEALERVKEFERKLTG